MITRPAHPTDFSALLALNQESVHFLSPLALESLERLAAQADLHQVVEDDGRVVAFVLALREGAAYDSTNYRWFSERYARFLYVDRIVVSVGHQGRGLGRLLYDLVFARAAVSRVPFVTCEYDIDPPNPDSARFHGRYGFVEVGRQTVGGGKKWVSLQAAPVTAQLARGSGIDGEGEA